MRLNIVSTFDSWVEVLLSRFVSVSILNDLIGHNQLLVFDSSGDLYALLFSLLIFST